MSKRASPEEQAMTPGEYLAKWRQAAGSIRKGATAAEVVRLHWIGHPAAYKLARLIRAGVKEEKNPRERSGPGPGCKPIPASEYLARWGPVVDALEAGKFVGTTRSFHLIDFL